MLGMMSKTCCFKVSVFELSSTALSFRAEKTSFISLGPANITNYKIINRGENAIEEETVSPDGIMAQGHITLFTLIYNLRNGNRKN